MTQTVQTETAPITLLWDIGTAYELFISLSVLHKTEQHGLRPSWAAGVRSRIPPAERKFLEEVIPFMSCCPAPWVYSLPGPKDAINAIWALRQIPAERRMIEMMDVEHWDKPDIRDIVLKITAQRSWSNRDRAAFKEIFTDKHHIDDAQGIDRYLDWWARPDEFGEAMVNALQAYHLVFFSEEEKRVAPILQAGLEWAKERAAHLSVPDLIVELSQGLRWDELKVKELIIVPAFWTTPLVVIDEINEDLGIFMFGARPANMSAIPGELVPDSLLQALKALADPTRLKILHFLTHEELTPSELSRRLSLRAPTVTHHLGELRLAGLVNLKMRGQEKLYSSRLEGIAGAFGTLQEFLK